MATARRGRTTVPEAGTVCRGPKRKSLNGRRGRSFLRATTHGWLARYFIQAQSLSAQGKYAEAILLKESAAIKERILGPDHHDVALVLEQYAAALREWAESTGHYRRIASQDDRA